MKFSIVSYHPVATWKWNLKPASDRPLEEQAAELDEQTNSLKPIEAQTDGDEGEDVCGICRVAFEGCCPECKKPGDDCPLSALLQGCKLTHAVFGNCTHVFHMHCLLRWLGTESSKGCCPLDRRQWGMSAPG